jgi:hypothetical protein
VIDTFTFTVVIAALVFNILNFLALRKSNNSCDTHVRDIIIDYELEKAKKLDKALKDTKQK